VTPDADLEVSLSNDERDLVRRGLQRQTLLKSDAAVPLPFADRQRERAIEHLRGMQKSNQILSGRC